MSFYKGFHFVRAESKADALQKMRAHQDAVDAYDRHQIAGQRAHAGVEFYKLEIARLENGSQEATAIDGRQRDPMQQEAARRQRHERQ